MKDVLRVLAQSWRRKLERQTRVREQARVNFGLRTSGLRPVVQVRQLDAQDGRLQRVESAVEADLAVQVFSCAAVHAQRAQTFSERVVVRRQESGFADRAQVLRRIETETTDAPHRTGPTTSVFRAD